MMNKYSSAFRLFGLFTLLLSIGGAVLLYLGLSWSLIVSWLISVNLVTFLVFGYDKVRALGGGLRVPENILHGLILLGGCIGGLGSMFLFRHKTRKGSFQQIFWVIVVLEIAGGIAWLMI